MSKPNAPPTVVKVDSTGVSVVVIAHLYKRNPESERNEETAKVPSPPTASPQSSGPVFPSTFSTVFPLNENARSTDPWHLVSPTVNLEKVSSERDTNWLGDFDQFISAVTRNVLSLSDCVRSCDVCECVDRISASGMLLFSKVKNVRKQSPVYKTVEVEAEL